MDNIISVYTKEDAVNDGYQQNITARAALVGFRVPVYITTGVLYLDGKETGKRLTISTRSCRRVISQY